MKHIVFAPHLDDEVIGCYSVWDKITEVVYFTNDYRAVDINKRLYIYNDDIKRANRSASPNHPKFIWHENYDFNSITDEDIVYIPSKYDYHPLHKTVRNMALGLKGKKMFYSVEMNVPWLEEESNSSKKLELLKGLYPKEDLFLTNAKYCLFKSIKPYDDIIMKQAFATSFYYQSFDKEEDERAEKIIWDISQELSSTQLERYHKIQSVLPNTIIKYNNGIIIIE